MNESGGVLIIADDHPLFRAAMRETVGRMLPDAEVLEAHDMKGLETVTAAHPEADLVLLDLHMPGALGFSSLVYLRSHFPSIPVVVVSALESMEVIQRAMDFGASGFIPKSASLDTIAEAITAVREGSLWFPEQVSDNGEDAELAERLSSLTPQQFRVLMMVADGLLNKQIAYELEVSEATVKAHVTAILRKLGLYRRTQAAVIAERLQVHQPRVDGGASATSG